jgi:hypothetical protein
LLMMTSWCYASIPKRRHNTSRRPWHNGWRRT